MLMTEQGAGSDVAHTASIAYPDLSDAGLTDNGAVPQSRGGKDLEPNWRLYGEKWFCSNPDADLAMVLARNRTDARRYQSCIALFNAQVATGWAA
jgi:alkylation response protein AidB-like acyl-CoA dehydrogenase